MYCSVILLGMDSEQQQNISTMPMVVWLRGDEEDFTLAAEDVMAVLDIKRSRLTQISGRELRVGRRRVDRYIKPFYRPADVHAYRDSTRAALTKQRSAEAVSVVADDIEERHKALLQATAAQLHAALANSSQRLQQDLSQLLISTQQRTNTALSTDSFLQTQKVLRVLEHMTRTYRTLFADITQQATVLHDSAAQKLQDILHTQRQQHDTAQTLQQETAANDAAHTAQLLALQQSSDSIVQQLRTIEEQHRSALQSLQESLSAKMHALEQHIAAVTQSTAAVTQSTAAVTQSTTAVIQSAAAVIQSTTAVIQQATALRPRVWGSLLP